MPLHVLEDGGGAPTPTRASSPASALSESQVRLSLSKKKTRCKMIPVPSGVEGQEEGRHRAMGARQLRTWICYS